MLFKVKSGAVLSCSVVPDGKRPFLPSETHLEIVILCNVPVQVLEQDVALVFRELVDLLRETNISSASAYHSRSVHVETLPSCDGVGTDHRVNGTKCLTDIVG